MASVTADDTSYEIPMYVAATKANLLSRAAAVQIGLINRVCEVSESIFGTIGNIKGKPVRIKLREDAEPYSVLCARRIPIPLLKMVEQQLQKMVEDNVIVKVTEPTEWSCKDVHRPEKVEQRD